MRVTTLEVWSYTNEEDGEQDYLIQIIADVDVLSPPEIPPGKSRYAASASKGGVIVAAMPYVQEDGITLESDGVRIQGTVQGTPPDQRHDFGHWFLRP